MRARRDPIDERMPTADEADEKGLINLNRLDEALEVFEFILGDPPLFFELGEPFDGSDFYLQTH